MIDQIYKILLTIINKENAGYVSPTEFNLLAANVQNEIFSEYFTEENRSKNRENRGLTNKGNSNLDYNDRQKIEQFAEFTGISISSGTFQLPVDLYFIGDDGVTIAGGAVVEEVEKVKINHLNNSEARPTEQFPVYTRYSNYIKVIPSSIEDIAMDYLRSPKAPQWTFQLLTNPDGSTVELYDPTNSSFQDFELHPSEFANITLRMLSFFGINLRETDITKMAELMKDKSYNKEIN
jgi:hypothetical protein